MTGTQQSRVGVVGLGAMGLEMARTLGRSGFAVTGFDVDPARRALFEETAESLAGLPSCDAVLLSLPNDAVVSAVAQELLTQGAPLIIDTSTISPDTARTLAAHAHQAGARYIDAPVSGGASGAADGALLMMVGGEPDAVALAAPILDSLSRKVVRCGGPGAGAVVKLTNNMLCAGQLLLVGEALRLAEAGDVAPNVLLEALNSGSGRSAITEVNAPKWILSDSFDSGFTVGLMAKDVKLAADLAGAGALSAEIAARWTAAVESFGASADFNRIVEHKE